MNIAFTLKHLRYLVALADEEHFGRAAEKCYVTQPTLSAAIKECEDILGVRVFERTKRSVMITPIGQRVIHQARKVLEEAGTLGDLARSVQTPLSGDLQVGVIPTIGPYLLPLVMSGLRDKFPDLRILFREDQTERLLQRLANGKLDLLVLALPYDSDGIRTLEFAVDPFYIAYPVGHRFDGLTRITNADIAREKLLLLEEGHCLRDHALDACSLAAAGAGREFEATSLTTLVHMVATGAGVTLLPKLAVDGGVTRGTDLRTRPLSEGNPARKIGLVWRRSSVRDDEFRMLADALGELTLLS